MATLHAYVLFVDRLGEMPRDATSDSDPRIRLLFKSVAADDMLLTSSTSNWLIWFMREMESRYNLDGLNYVERQVAFFDENALRHILNLFDKFFVRMLECPEPAMSFHERMYGEPPVDEYVRQFLQGQFRFVDDDNHP